MDAVGDGARAMSDFVRPDPSLFKLGGLGADVDVVGIDVDVVTWFELYVAVMKVGVALLSLLSRFHAGLGGFGDPCASSV